MTGNHHPDDEGTANGSEEADRRTDSTSGLDVHRRTFVRSLGASVGASALLAGDGRRAAAQETGTRLPATVTEDVEQPTAVRTFPVLEWDDDAEVWQQTGTRPWRTVRGTGNCCENYLAVAPNGAVYDMGAS